MTAFGEALAASSTTALGGASCAARITSASKGPSSECRAVCRIELPAPLPTTAGEQTQQ